MENKLKTEFGKPTNQPLGSIIPSVRSKTSIEASDVQELHDWAFQLISYHHEFLERHPKLSIQYFKENLAFSSEIIEQNDLLENANIIHRRRVGISMLSKEGILNAFLVARELWTSKSPNLVSELQQLRLFDILRQNSGVTPFGEELFSCNSNVPGSTIVSTEQMGPCSNNSVLLLEHCHSQLSTEHPSSHIVQDCKTETHIKKRKSLPSLHVSSTLKSPGVESSPLPTLTSTYLASQGPPSAFDQLQHSNVSLGGQFNLKDYQSCEAPQTSPHFKASEIPLEFPRLTHPMSEGHFDGVDSGLHHQQWCWGNLDIRQARGNPMEVSNIVTAVAERLKREQQTQPADIASPVGLATTGKSLNKDLHRQEAEQQLLWGLGQDHWTLSSEALAEFIHAVDRIENKKLAKGTVLTIENPVKSAALSTATTYLSRPRSLGNNSGAASVDSDVSKSSLETWISPRSPLSSSSVVTSSVEGSPRKRTPSRVRASIKLEAIRATGNSHSPATQPSGNTTPAYNTRSVATGVQSPTPSMGREGKPKYQKIRLTTDLVGLGDEDQAFARKMRTYAYSSLSYDGEIPMLRQLRNRLHEEGVEKLMHEKKNNEQLNNSFGFADFARDSEINGRSMMCDKINSGDKQQVTLTSCRTMTNTPLCDPVWPSERSSITLSRSLLWDLTYAKTHLLEPPQTSSTSLNRSVISISGFEGLNPIHTSTRGNPKPRTPALSIPRGLIYTAILNDLLYQEPGLLGIYSRRTKECKLSRLLPDSTNLNTHSNMRTWSSKNNTALNRLCLLTKPMRGRAFKKSEREQILKCQLKSDVQTSISDPLPNTVDGVESLPLESRRSFTGQHPPPKRHKNGNRQSNASMFKAVDEDVLIIPKEESRLLKLIIPLSYEDSDSHLWDPSVEYVPHVKCVGSKFYVPRIRRPLPNLTGHIGLEVSDTDKNTSLEDILKIVGRLQRIETAFIRQDPVTQLEKDVQERGVRESRRPSRRASPSPRPLNVKCHRSPRHSPRRSPVRSPIYIQVTQSSEPTTPNSQR